MKYTPLDIRHQEFSAALSGYSKREVREFLVQLADQTEEYERDTRALQERVSALEAQVLELKEGEEVLRRAVVSAERIANDIRQNAEKESQLLGREAEAAKEKLLREGLQRARDMRVEIEKIRAEKALFIDQFRALLRTYIDNLDRVEDRTVG